MQRHAAIRQLSPRTFLRLRPRRTYAAPIALSRARFILRQGMAPACLPASRGPCPHWKFHSLPHLASLELASKPWSVQGRETEQGLCPCQAFIVPGRGHPLQSPLGRSQQPSRAVPMADITNRMWHSALLSPAESRAVQSKYNATPSCHFRYSSNYIFKSQKKQISFNPL